MEPVGIRAKAKAATRAKIIASAKTLFETKGYEATTMRDIAAGADATTGAIFARFPGKDAIYHEVFGHLPVSTEQGAELLRALDATLSNPRVPWPPNDIDALLTTIKTAIKYEEQLK